MTVPHRTSAVTEAVPAADRSRSARAERGWTIADAKARLSEVLRRTHTEGPQFIGRRRRYVVMPFEDWQARAEPKMGLGEWLVANAPRCCDDFELPSRDDGDREIPFADLMEEE